MYLCDAVAGPLHGALLRNAWLDSENMFCDSSGCVGCFALLFYVKANSDPEVVSVLLSWLGLRATLHGLSLHGCAHLHKMRRKDSEKRRVTESAQYPCCTK